MAVGPWFPQAARLLRENPGLDVGLHLALTSEWENVKWRPLTTAPSLSERTRLLLPDDLALGPNYGKHRALHEQSWKLDEIERELRAQIELTKREVPQLSHLSDHMGFQAIGPAGASSWSRRLAAEYGLGDRARRGPACKCAGWDGQPKTPTEKVASFRARARGVSPRGRTSSSTTPRSTRPRCGRPATSATRTWRSIARA